MPRRNQLRDRLDVVQVVATGRRPDSVESHQSATAGLENPVHLRENPAAVEKMFECRHGQCQVETIVRKVKSGGVHPEQTSGRPRAIADRQVLRCIKRYADVLGYAEFKRTFECETVG